MSTPKDKLHSLRAALGRLGPYSKHSRVHLLKTIGNTNNPCFIKRDDELSFGISGSKLRKFLSLIPNLQETQTEEAILIGSAYSNNVVGLCQFLIENNIKPVLFLLGEGFPQKIQGNLLLTSFMVPSETIHWVSREEWPFVEQKAHDYVKFSSKKCRIIPEGSSMPEALPGALTLPIDILKNEQDLQKDFHHVFMDAGTGLMAIATILAFAWLQKDTCVHVVLLAEDEKAFLRRLQQLKTHFETLIGEDLSDESINKVFQMHFPTRSVSFGSTNSSVFQEIAMALKEEGVLLDPIYSAKLFSKTKEILKVQDLKGSSLLIHSGGALTLLGFQDQLLKAASKI